MPISLTSMLYFRRYILPCFFVVFVGSLNAADTFPALEAGGSVYKNVRVISKNESSISVMHSGGLSQIKLANLSPELQAKYGYSQTKDNLRTQELAIQNQQQATRESLRIQKLRKKEAVAAVRSVPKALTGAFANFGETPELKAEVDLRPTFRLHGLTVRNQGPRPSCSVHSIVAALEYQYAETQGKVLNLSEHYLMRATSKSIGRPLLEISNPRDESATFTVPQDLGFALEHVFQAIRGYGLALEQENSRKLELDEFDRIDEVSFSPYRITGGNSENGIQNLIHVLNANMPVVIGTEWPVGWRIQKTSLLSKQPAERGAGHAVTLVGYRCEGGNIENVKFIFRNSWGPRWGAGGYGFITYGYLRKHLTSSYVVELK